MGAVGGEAKAAVAAAEEEAEAEAVAVAEAEAAEEVVVVEGELKAGGVAEAAEEGGRAGASATGRASWKPRTRQRKLRSERSGHSTWAGLGSGSGLGLRLGVGVRVKARGRVRGRAGLGLGLGLSSRLGLGLGVGPQYLGEDNCASGRLPKKEVRYPLLAC